MKSPLRLLVASVLLLGLAPPAQAVTIYTTFGPGDSYGGSNYLIGTSQQQVIAGMFVPGFDATLDSIRVATHFFQGDNNFTVYLASDSGGVPGAALESFTNVAFVSTPGSIVTLNSILHPMLNTGATYWVVVTAADLTKTDGGWFFNDQGIDSGMAHHNTDSGGVWFASPPGSGQTTPAFDVSGTAAAAVPEPVTLLMLGLGAGLVLRRQGSGRGSAQERRRAAGVPG
jgi:hypothetical protein